MAQKKIEEFENTRKDLIPLSCFVCGIKAFEKVSETDRFGFLYPTGICKSCGNVQQIKYYGEEDIVRFYSKFYREIYTDGGVKNAFFEQRKRGVKIIKFITKEKLSGYNSILEVGAGAGGVLKEFQKIGKDVTGLDYNDEYIGYARNKGIFIKKGGTDDLEKDKKYDFIILSHVLEHILRPKEFLGKLKKALSSNGKLYIEVPSLNSVEYGYANYDLKEYFQNAHIIHFTKDIFKRFIRYSGLEIEKMDGAIRCVCHSGLSPDDTVEDEENYYNKNFLLLKSIEKEFSKRKYVIGFKRKLSFILKIFKIYYPIKRFVFIFLK